MSGDLVAWLREQVDEDAQIARAAGDAFLHSDRIGMPSLHPSVHRHVYSWTTARVLAEVESKRRILDEHRATDGVGGPACDRCSADEDGQHGMGWWVPSPCRTLRLLALPYAERPGWRDEWRPE